MVTSFDATDKLIAEIAAGFNALSGKLIGVQDDFQYRAITGTKGLADPQLTGETKQKVDEAQTLISGLWVVADLVGHRLDEVKSKRATAKTGLFSGGGVAKELEDQLRLHNLVISENIADKLPGELRQLLFTEKVGFTSCEQTIKVGADQLKVGAKAIIEVAECMAALKALIADTEVKLAEVLPVVAKIGGAAKLAHSNAVSNIATLKLTYEHDPLGVKKGFEQTVGQHIAAINKALEGVQRAKEKAYADLGDARVLMQRLEDKQPTPARTPELKDWLAKLAARLDQEDWASASAGLDDWIKDASSVLAIKVPPSSYQPPAQTPAQHTPAQHQQPHGQTPAHQPPAHQPPAHTYNQPPAPRVQQVPTSADYHRYAPTEKSNLEKLLDGELATPSSSTTAPAVQRPVDPDVEKLVAAQTPASTTPTSSTTFGNSAIDALVNGQGTTPQTDGRQTADAPPKTNAALDDLVNGQSTTGNTTTPPGPGADRAKSSIEDLLADKPVQPVKPSQSANTPAAPAKPAGTEVASSGTDSSKITELFDESPKPKPAPPTVKGKEVTPPAHTDTANKPAPAASQAEQDAAQRKALEDLLKS